MGQIHETAGIPPYKVFFSHGGEDTYIVNNSLRGIVEKTGALVFVDAKDIEYGDDFRKVILDELAHCEELLVLLTHSSIRRAWVLAEIGAALVRNVRLVVVRYGIADEELHASGVLSLLGANSLLSFDGFDKYLTQLKGRVGGKNNGQR